MKTIYFGAGCFWGAQKFFNYIDGVVASEVGYANGPQNVITYKEVCASSGHVEVVKVQFNENILELSLLIECFFSIIDPTSLNQQGGDIGIQYRTGIYYIDDADAPIINACINTLKQKYDTIYVEVLALQNYCKAEEYHQNYLDKNEDGYCHVGTCAFEYAKNANKK